MQRYRYSVGILEAAPAELCGELRFAFFGDGGVKILVVNNFLVRRHFGLGNAHVGIVGILNFKTKTASVAELVEGEAAQPLRLFVLYSFAEFGNHLRLLVRANNVAISVQLAHYHGLGYAAVKKFESFIGFFGQVKNMIRFVTSVAVSPALGHVKGPAPVEGNILIH